MLKTPSTSTGSKAVAKLSSHQVARFGSFEVDFRERKLTKGGIRIRLQEQPFRILALLLERPGELVTREQIRLQVWPQDLFVDFDAALNTAVGKLRAALNDSADSPRFLETVPRHGYRFVAPVVWPSEVEEPVPVSSKQQGKKRLYLWYIGALIVTGGALAGFWQFRHPAPKITSTDTIVLADFVNTTGDAAFDGALNTALRVSLQQSPFFKVLSDSAIARTLKQMTRPANTPLTAEVTRELCQRAGSKAFLAGSIGTLGSEYVVGLKAVNCRTGDALAEELVSAQSKEKVLDALGQAAAKIRAELGESLASVQRFDAPLALATTSSLEALKLYSLGVRTFDEKGPPDSLPYFQRVVQIDPNFAAAYRLQGLVYAGLGQTDRASEYFTKAFHLQDRVSEWERLAITADYYMNVTGELNKAAATYERWTDLYPNNGPLSTLGIVYALQGQYEKAIETTNRALSFGPSYGSYANLVSYNLALHRFDEAQKVLDQAQSKRLDGLQIRATRYAFAFLRSDPSAMAEQQKWFAGKPEENYGLSLASDTEAYRGHLNVARELTARAVASAIRADNKESGAIWLANAALRDAAFGDALEARQTAAKALRLAPTSQGIEAEAALALAMTGDRSRAASLAQSLNKRFPLDTQIQSLWLPAIRTQLAISGKNPGYILTDPQNVSPIEYGGLLFTLNPSCLYPTYIRGNAYLAAGRGKEAAAEFQKVLDHSGVVWNCWTGALAHLGVARANALQATTSQGSEATAALVRAQSAYNEFLTLWKDADPNIPILKQAKAEYARVALKW
ncbi:MAG TPA: winged helix-turn-helix domain-containing protein [Candidatus Angelobacter sp.]|jgi:DNA-binding winged helix-turn-helix (wHTH) protein/tetratricopeptide (TPR) repeat protein